MIDITEILDVKEQQDYFVPFGPGSKNGSNFEKFVAEKINAWCASNNWSEKKEFVLEHQPRYVDHYGWDNRRKDFKIKMGSMEIMVEAKWLGSMNTECQKLDYEWNNLAHGCYGNYFMLFYDYEKSHKNIHKMNLLKRWVKKFKYALLRKDIYFEFIEVNKYFSHQMDFAIMNFLDSKEQEESFSYWKDCTTMSKISERMDEPKVTISRTDDGKIYVNQ